MICLVGTRSDEVVDEGPEEPGHGERPYICTYEYRELSKYRTESGDIADLSAMAQRFRRIVCL